MPQSIDPIVEAPHPPPHFSLESIPTYELYPPVLQLYRQGAQDAAHAPPCHCYLDLSIPFVEEDDPTVILSVRWFVDYDPAVPATVRPWYTQESNQGFDNPATLRPLNAWTFDADALDINTSGVHTVDVVVGESAGFDPASTAQPNRAMKSGYTSDVYRFFVNVIVEQDPAVPVCPGNGKPSERVCQ